MDSLTRAKAQMEGLRCSYPPYYVAAQSLGGDPVAAFPGQVYNQLQRGFAPSVEESRLMLIELRKMIRWSRSSMAAFLGVNENSLRRWETGERQPSLAARRLIWLTNILARNPAELKSAFDVIIWGKEKQLRLVSDALNQVLS